MRAKLMRVGGVFVLSLLIGIFCTLGADAAVKKKNKHIPPEGWQYQAGSTLWRLERGLGVSVQTWRKYVREKKWRQKRGRESMADRLILKSLDWTVEELAALLEALEDEPLFLPAGMGLEP